MIMLDHAILNEISEQRNHSPGTKRQYKYVIEDYVRFQKKQMYKLIEEAEKEEDKGVRWKRRKLRTSLLNFRTYLYDKYDNPKTAAKKLQLIISVYKHYEIELQPLPKLSTIKNSKPKKIITYDDLPDKEIIKRALEIASPLMRAVILFQSSSGCARRETVNLTIGDLICSLKEYTDSEDIYEIIQTLKDKNNIVPTFKLTRQKTGNTYYTFCSPESVKAILEYLESENRYLKPEFPLFKISDRVLLLKYGEINDKLELGRKGNYRRFRSHMLRKFHASNLYQGENSLTMDEIDQLQGRRKSTVHTSYFMENPSDLKNKYVLAMDKLLINLELEKLTIESPEVIKIRKDKELAEKRYNHLKENIDLFAEKAVETKVQDKLNAILGGIGY